MMKFEWILHQLWLIVKKCHGCANGLSPFCWSFRFHTFHLDRSPTLEMTWRDHEILRIAIMMQGLVHVDVTESLVTLLWDQL